MILQLLFRITRYKILKQALYISLVYCIFMVNHEDTFTRCNKYSSKLDISRSFLRIFMVIHEDTFTRCNKYSSKLDISRSFLRIFAII